MPERELTHLEVPCFVDYSEALAGRELMAHGLGPDFDLWMLALDEEGHEVLRFSEPGAPPESIRLPEGQRKFHHVQPLPGGELLLVDGRCEYRDEAAPADRNAVVYSREGVATRELTLGDGIQDVQTTTDGRLWVSYFDEGVLGNGRWAAVNPSVEPMGRSGLVLFDSRGRRLSEYDANAVGTDIIIDCYALNVASDDETWLYFYTDFPLVRLRAGSRPAAWRTPVAGASALAVGSTHVLFGGSYSARSTFELFVLDGHRKSELIPAGSFVFVDSDGSRWQPNWMCGRGPWLYGGEGTRAFRIDLDTLVALAKVWH